MCPLQHIFEKKNILLYTNINMARLYIQFYAFTFSYTKFPHNEKSIKKKVYKF